MNLRSPHDTPAGAQNARDKTFSGAVRTADATPAEAVQHRDASPAEAGQYRDVPTAEAVQHRDASPAEAGQHRDVPTAEAVQHRDVTPAETVQRRSGRLSEAVQRRDDALAEAVCTVRERVRSEPTVAMILGSGLGDLADAVESAVAIPTADIPNYPASTVAGHSGRLVFGRLEGHDVLIVQGRAHLYEGHAIHDVVFPVHLVRALGACRLLVTNAAGAIRPLLRPGTLMFITDHVNMVFESPVRARARAPRPPRTAHPYDPEWIDAAERIALELGIRSDRGVYAWTRGPTYETKAEIAAFRRLGADAVGMSTVPEVLTAAELGMKVLGISSITNPAAGLSKVPLSHEEVLQVGRRIRGDLERLVRGILRDLG